MCQVLCSDNVTSVPPQTHDAVTAITPILQNIAEVPGATERRGPWKWKTCLSLSLTPLGNTVSLRAAASPCMFASLIPVGLFTAHWAHSLILLAQVLQGRSLETLLHLKFSSGLQLPPNGLLLFRRPVYSDERERERSSLLVASHFWTRGWAVPGQVPVLFHFPVAEGYQASWG